MPEIGLFPLGLVLLPTEQAPLHIFEPRYLELIADCIAADQEFGILLADDIGETREVGTRVSVIEVLEQLPDGRMNIAVEGRARFRLVQLTEGRSYQTAEVEPYDDESDDRDDETAEWAFALYRRLAALVPAPPDDPDPDAALLSFEIGARVDFGAEPKQQLLELRSEDERLVLVCELLERAAEALENERELRARASQNGKVVPGDH
ncbi:MAG: LON peptidase substrate-binding domain-containing protein [Gaiellaceae bacterium]